MICIPWVMSPAVMIVGASPTRSKDYKRSVLVRRVNHENAHLLPGAPTPRLGRSRVNARTIPIPMAIAKIEDPPNEINGKVMPFVGIRFKVDAILIMA